MPLDGRDSVLDLALTPKPGHHWQRRDADGDVFRVARRSVAYLVEEEGSA